MYITSESLKRNFGEGTKRMLEKDAMFCVKGI